MELMVVVAVFSTISVIVLANHSKFNSSVLLGSLAYNIALSVREAQVYGLSVQEVDSSFQSGYGIHFAGPSSFLFFADKNMNRLYDGEPTDKIMKSYTLNSQHSISRFCGYTAVSGGQQCSNGEGGTTISYLDIVFLRPDPDAYMRSNQFTGYSRAEIKVRSTSGEERTVTVAPTGQISVVSQ